MMATSITPKSVKSSTGEQKPSINQIYINDEVLQYAAFISSRKKYWTPDLDRLLRKWQRQLSLRQHGHKEGEAKYKIIYLSLGIPGIILAAIISAAIFGTFQDCACQEVCNSEWVRVASGIVALLSAILTAVSSFVDAGSIREKHKSSADSYGELSHKIETVLRTPIILRGDPLAVIEETRTSFDSTVKDSPYIPPIYETTLPTHNSPIPERKAEKVHKREESKEEIIDIPNVQQELAINFDIRKLSFDPSLVKSLNFELNRLNTVDEGDDGEETDE